ncbi:MAG TPA: aspartate--tRNA ligase [Candidatus Aminicenantes bacterium]|mgnify:CR=1 FL=1|nr:aspartate--tRNA ligase [Candidatus Aminicenantes bacterium]
MAESKVLKRERYCGQIDESLVGTTVTVYGWVGGIRELGAITFLDLRDREGIVQVMVGGDEGLAATVKRIGREYVLAVTGLIRLRENPNPELPTGKVEIRAEEIEILNEARLPPFFPENRATVSEELRFRHRYLDLRHPQMQRNFRLRSQVALAVRQVLGDHGFVEVETPILANATPEGARDYLVPSRIYKGRMFALPQSPQQFKQILMVSGFERYYQFARCFRDEDLRADRQPEFTQIDIEMSFASENELQTIVEELMASAFAQIGVEVPRPFPRLTWQEAMDTYGSDKPDLRNPLRITDVTAATPLLKSTILDGIVAAGGTVRALVVPGADRFSRKTLDDLQEFVKGQGGQGVIWLRKTEAGFKGSLKADSAAIEAFYRDRAIDPTAITFLLGGPAAKVLPLAGRLRDRLGKEAIDPGERRFLWVVDFPLFFFNEEEGRVDSNHHPFTAPKPEDIPLLESAPLKVRSIAYDLVLNGVEVGGGSQRIHQSEIQQAIFRLLKHTEQEIQERFGFFLKALSFGAPPHLGLAIGFDRLMMLICGEESIRELIAFPKTTSSLCLLTGAPSAVPPRQLDDLGLTVKETP